MPTQSERIASIESIVGAMQANLQRLQTQPWPVPTYRKIEAAISDAVRAEHVLRSIHQVVDRRIGNNIDYQILAERVRPDAVAHIQSHVTAHFTRQFERHKNDLQLYFDERASRADDLFSRAEQYDQQARRNVTQLNEIKSGYEDIRNAWTSLNNTVMEWRRSNQETIAQFTAMNGRLDTENRALKNENATLKRRLDAIEATLATLETAGAVRITTKLDADARPT